MNKLFATALCLTSCAGDMACGRPGTVVQVHIVSQADMNAKARAAGLVVGPGQAAHGLAQPATRTIWLAATPQGEASFGHELCHIEQGKWHD